MRPSAVADAVAAAIDAVTEDEEGPPGSATASISGGEPAVGGEKRRSARSDLRQFSVARDSNAKTVPITGTVAAEAGCGPSSFPSPAAAVAVGGLNKEAKRISGRRAPPKSDECEYAE